MSDYEKNIVRTAPLMRKVLEDFEQERAKLDAGSGAAKPLANSAGVKYDQGKPMIALIPAVALEEEGKVWTFGAQKYGFWNWHKGLSYVRILSGVLRHISAMLRGEDIDPESGLPHAAHARCGLGMILQFQAENRKELDDRMKK